MTPLTNAQQLPFKAIFTDLDGTAIPSGRNNLPSQKVINAVAKAQEKVYVSVATGRPLELCREILEKLQIKNLCIVEGGSVIINPVTEEVVWEQIMTSETFDKVLKALAPYKYLERIKGAKPITADETILTGTTRMLFFFGCSETEADMYSERLKTIPEITVLKVKSWRRKNWDLHILHIGASKRHALEVLLGILKLEAHEVIGIGDSQNDLPLFEAAGFKIAMGNAIEELKVKADYIAPSVDDDGLAHAIEKFILNV